MSRRINIWAALAAIAAGLSGIEVAKSAEPARSLEIYFIDVEGGAATLLITPLGESVLIDSGWPGFQDRDPKRIAHALVDLAGLKRLDHLITTHWHRDHFGGVAGLSAIVPIEHFWDRGLPEDHEPSASFPDGPAATDPLGIAYRKASAGKRKALHAGDLLPLAGSTKLGVLAASGRVIEPRAVGRIRSDFQAAPSNPGCAESPPDLAPDPSDNANSLVFLLTLGKFQFFDGGDLTWNVEKRLVCPIDLVGPVDLYQVTHHGMDISNHPTLVQTLAPTVAIMNNGPRKGGAPGTVKLLGSIPSIQAAYQLHRNVATSDGDNTDPTLIANKSQDGGTFIRARVDADGTRFHVKIGENGPERSFESK